MRRRLLLSTVGIAVLVALLLGVPTALLVDRLAYATARSQAERQAVSIGLALEPALVSGRVPTPALLEAIVGDQEQVTLVTPSGRRITGGAVAGAAITVSAPGPVGTRIELSTGDDEVRREIRRSWTTLLAVAVLVVGIAVALALVQSRRLSLPLRRLQRQAQRIGEGDFTAATPRAGLVEIDAIGAALDEASARIAQLVAAERAFSANASHQLRTALTGVTLRLDLLAAHPDPAVRDEARAALEQTDRLLGTVEELLRLARTGRTGEQKDLDLYTLARQHVEDWSDRLRGDGRSIRLSGSSPTPARISPGGIGQAMDVLIDNAWKHGAGTVSVRVQRSGQHAEVLVEDEGVGVADDVALFRHAPHDAGHGLGLPLARALVQADGGSLDLVRHRPPQFRMRLPSGSAGD